VLRAPAEHARLDAGVNLLRRHSPGGCIPEIGCGEALLQRRLAPDDDRSFVGVDISDGAIARARVFADARVRYVVAFFRGDHKDSGGEHCGLAG